MSGLFQNKQTWKLSFMRRWLKLFGMTTTPLWTLKRSATWALLLLCFLAMATRSSSSNNGGHVTFTLLKWMWLYVMEAIAFLYSHYTHYCILSINDNHLLLDQRVIGAKWPSCELHVMCIDFHRIPGRVSGWPYGAVSHYDNILLPAVLKQLWLSEIGMAFNLQTQCQTWEDHRSMKSIIFNYFTAMNHFDVSMIYN